MLLIDVLQISRYPQKSVLAHSRQKAFHSWLVAWNIFFVHILGMSSSQLTFICFKMVRTTNQIAIIGKISPPKFLDSTHLRYLQMCGQLDEPVVLLRRSFEASHEG